MAVKHRKLDPVLMLHCRSGDIPEAAGAAV